MPYPRQFFRRLPKISVVALAVWCGCGFMVTQPMSCAQRRAAAREQAQWVQLVGERYDFLALHAFLRRAIADTPRWEDIDLNVQRLDPGWTTGSGPYLVCGAWSFRAADLEKAEFTLSFTYPVGPAKSRMLSIECRRVDRGHFQVIRLSSEELIELVT